jgi:hypothetical protein
MPRSRPHAACCTFAGSAGSQSGDKVTALHTGTTFHGEPRHVLEIGNPRFLTPEACRRVAGGKRRGRATTGNGATTIRTLEGYRTRPLRGSERWP